MPKPKIVIDAWAKLQHFKDRAPVWVKLYLALRNDRRWRQLSGDGCKLYVDLVLLAADDEPLGSISLYPEDLAWEVRLTVPDLIALLAEVDQCGLIHASGYHADIKRITAGHQDDDEPMSLTRSREVEGEREVEVEKETTSDHPNGYDPDILHVDDDELILFCRDFGIPIEEMNRTLSKLNASHLLPTD